MTMTVMMIEVEVLMVAVIMKINKVNMEEDLKLVSKGVNQDSLAIDQDLDRGSINSLPLTNSLISNKGSRVKEALTTIRITPWTTIDLDLNLEVNRDLVVDNSLVRAEIKEARGEEGNKIIVLEDNQIIENRTSSIMTTLMADRTTSEDLMMTETTATIHLDSSQNLLMMITVLLDSSSKEETVLEDRTGSEDKKVIPLVSLKLLLRTMVHLVSLITLVVVVKTALEDNKITMVL